MASPADSDAGFADEWELVVELDAATCEAISSIDNGGAFLGMCMECVGRGGGGVSPRFRIRIDPNSLGKSDVKVDC